MSNYFSKKIQLWNEVMRLLLQLRPACSRERTFLWLMTSVVALCLGTDLAGVTGLVRALGFCESCYEPLLRLFHSSALCPERLAAVWAGVVMRAHPGLVFHGERLVVLVDGIKRPKSGRKMPAAKTLHQDSQSNSKSEYIKGHSCQAITVLGRAGAGYHAVPLACRICEGVKNSPSHKTTLFDRLFIMLERLNLQKPMLVVADAFYSNSSMVKGLCAGGHALLSRTKHNTIAFLPIRNSPERKRRGRPKKYGKKVNVRDFLQARAKKTESPLTGEKGLKVRIASEILTWKATGQPACFTWAQHPSRGTIVLVCTDLSVSPEDMLRLYSLRWKIEVSFKQSIHTLGAYEYHFWMMNMRPTKQRCGDMFLHRCGVHYKKAVARKIAAYHRFIQVGLIAQGILQLMAVKFPSLVWASWGSWIRTIRPGVCPSERVVATALSNSYFDFLSADIGEPSLQKFLRPRTRPSNTDYSSRAA